jgi:hypothetical protein
LYPHGLVLFALRDKDCAIFYSGDKYYRGRIGEAAGTAQMRHGHAGPLPIMGVNGRGAARKSADVTERKGGGEGGI